MWLPPFRNRHWRESPHQKMLLNIVLQHQRSSLKCVCAAQSVALPVSEANLTGTQAPMQTDTIKKFSTGGVTQTHTRIST